jgi:hygromycin-B 7''-O-kinase
VPADFADLQATDAALLLSDVFPDRPAAEYIRRTGGELSTVYEAQLGGEPALAAAIDRHVAERTALFADCEHAVLCHNDFHEGNILVRRDDQGNWQICGVIDVENAIAADPLTDLAKTDRYSIRGHRAKLDGLLAGYGPRGAAAAERMDLYGLYHALELWDWFASTHQTDRLTGLTSDMREMVR